MSGLKGHSIRHHKRRTDDGKGVRRMIAGQRFRSPAGVGIHEANQRFSRIEELWQDNEAFCQQIGRDPEWTDIALWAAEHLRKGELRIPLPPLDDILASYGDQDWSVRLNLIVDRYTDEQAACHYPRTIDGLPWSEAKTFYEVVSEAFPSVHWVLPAPIHEKVVDFHETAARFSLERLAEAKNQAPPDPNTPLVAGTLHEALEGYERKRQADFTLPDGSFDGSGHHMVGIVRTMRERHSDFPLAELDFARCQELVDFWRNRPLNQRTEEPLSKKTCQNYIGEIKRFFDWLHLAKDFGWRKPQDSDLLKTKVRSLPSDRPSLGQMQIETFSTEELTLLYKHAVLFERLLLVWCLNCAHGAAEFGRVEWEDLFLHQEHPWRKQGLKIHSGEADSWCGFLRPKSDVLGWWLLWSETVQLIEWWRRDRQKALRREPLPTERVLLTANGNPLFRDYSRNAQTGFANAWTRLLKRVREREGDHAVRRLPFGTLRNQLPDWLGGEHARAIVASVALCHGIPHKGDKLLYRHYSNRPWVSLFTAQQDYRQHLQAIFTATPDPLVELEPKER